MSSPIRYGIFFCMLFFGIWAIVPNEAAAQEKIVKPAAHSDPQVCSGNGPEVVDERAQWLLRAYQHLDCLIGIVDESLKKPPGRQNDTKVQISREELEHLRTLAWWAKDAAARIGR